ncbi:cytochrome c-550 PedF [Paracraurococcus lichenis]|uniref:Cytochrome c-550 PedF n=1 Tax=Paracraurococcus lichenis TaxID=3064888 RepID=A0ABT9E0N1_9PROT|nr:cytochrome c-550 PedF [Paracraurococcus sp. LOR1-02]MDO9709727.1 cytochrome c-550 PedF [Paracraurococcus sp. LOR1-02]
MRRSRLAVVVIAGLAAALPATRPSAHGDVTPQPVDTTELEPLGEDWREQNPYSGNALAIRIGSSGYNQNCARCHGLEVISGGLAPDLRYLEKGREGDEWFLQRVRHGATQNGITRMPAFEGVLSQEALWSIRAFIESKHEG